MDISRRSSYQLLITSAASWPIPQLYEHGTVVGEPCPVAFVGLAVGEVVRAERVRQVYTAVDALNQQFGKYTVYLGSSLPAVMRSRHQGSRGVCPSGSAHA